MTASEILTRAFKYRFSFSREPKLNAKQGEKLRNAFYSLRGKGDSDFPLYPLNNP